MSTKRSGKPLWRKEPSFSKNARKNFQQKVFFMRSLSLCNSLSPAFLGSAANELKLLLVHPSTSVKGAICNYTDDIKPDLVVCGSRGMGAMGRAFLGSTSDYLMHNAKCSTMIVKPPPSSESETTAGNDARLHCG